MFSIALAIDRISTTRHHVIVASPAVKFNRLSLATDFLEGREFQAQRFPDQLPHVLCR